LRTYTIPTTKPNEVVAPLRDRMPVILAPGEYDGEYQARYAGKSAWPMAALRLYLWAQGEHSEITAAIDRREIRKSNTPDWRV
jgi:hypothetical protein